MDNQRYFIVATHMNMPKNKLQAEWQQVVRDNSQRIFESTEELNRFWNEMGEVYKTLKLKHNRCRPETYNDFIVGDEYRFMGVPHVATWQVYKEKEVDNG